MSKRNNVTNHKFKKNKREEGTYHQKKANKFNLSKTINKNINQETFKQSFEKTSSLITDNEYEVTSEIEKNY